MAYPPLIARGYSNLYENMVNTVKPVFLELIIPWSGVQITEGPPSIKGLLQFVGEPFSLPEFFAGIYCPTTRRMSTISGFSSRLQIESSTSSRFLISALL